MKVFVDHNISPTIARALNELFKGQHEVVALGDKYPRTISDIDWISALDREGRWIIISGDRRITRNKAEQAAFRASKHIGMFMAPGLFKAPVIKQAERLLALWPSIETAAGVVQGGAMFELPLTTLRLRTI